MSLQTVLGVALNVRRREKLITSANACQVSSRSAINDLRYSLVPLSNAVIPDVLVGNTITITIQSKTNYDKNMTNTSGNQGR